MTDVDTEPGVSVDPRRREVPGWELGPWFGLPIGHLFFLEALSVPAISVQTSSAPTPVALLFLHIQAVLFGGSSSVCRGRGAGGGSAGGLWVRVCAEALKVPQFIFLLDAQLKLSQGLFRMGVWFWVRDVHRRNWRWRVLCFHQNRSRFGNWGRVLKTRSFLTRKAWLWDWTRRGVLSFWWGFRLLCLFRFWSLLSCRRTTVQSEELLFIWWRRCIIVTRSPGLFVCVSRVVFAPLKIRNKMF